MVTSFFTTILFFSRGKNYAKKNPVFSGLPHLSPYNENLEPEGNLNSSTLFSFWDNAVLKWHFVRPLPPKRLIIWGSSFCSNSIMTSDIETLLLKQRTYFARFWDNNQTIQVSKYIDFFRILKNFKTPQNFVERTPNRNLRRDGRFGGQKKAFVKNFCRALSSTFYKLLKLLKFSRFQSEMAEISR